MSGNRSKENAPRRVVGELGDLPPGLHPSCPTNASNGLFTDPP